MDFPNRLQPLDSVEDPEEKHVKLMTWSTDIEAFLASPSVSSEEEKESTDETIQDVAWELHRGIVSAVLSRDVSREAVEIDSLEACNSDFQSMNETNTILLFENIRAAKNLLRWYIQVYLGKKKPQEPSLVKILKTTTILKLLVRLLESGPMDSEAQRLERSRDISLSIFYATYVAFPGDEQSLQSLEYVMKTLEFPKVALKMLNVTPCSIPLALSLVRNIHNAMVTVPGISVTVLATQTTVEQKDTDNSSWRCTQGSTDFKSTLSSMLLWLVDSADRLGQDRATDLVTEILDLFYAIRLGSALNHQSSDVSLLKALTCILKLPLEGLTNVRQCQLSALSLLMDSPADFGNFLFQEGCIAPILSILEIQVTDVVNNTRVDNSAVASLVPVLVVLNKYAAVNHNILHRTKELIFPQDAEAAFQDKVRSQQMSHSKNMGPLDAPKGTLRGNMVSLMTWPTGHIKRCTGELLFVLCSSDPKEFVYRVGLGNAVLILNAKGFASMPVPTGTE